MTQELYSVEQVAHRLGLHVRTVRNYVRDGRLKAIRIGKQYRIARRDLAAMTGDARVSQDDLSATRERHIEASSIVQIDGIGREAASRVTTGLMATVNGRNRDDDPLRVDTIYDEERERLKVILTGSLETTGQLLKMIRLYTDA